MMSERVVVIGSGPAGAAAALFLARAGCETLVMEVGAKDAPLGFTARLRGFTLARRKESFGQREDFARTGDPATEIYEKLAPGGLSNHWACAVPRFADDDFRDAARAGEAYTWPLGYADLAPWYDQVEPLLRIAAGTVDTPRLPAGRVRDRWRLTRAWDDVTRAAADKGRSVVVMPYANGATTQLTHASTAFNAYAQWLVPALRKGELSMLYGARALRLEWSAKEQRVVAVIYRDEATGREERLPCRAVVVAAGALNSAQLLLQSTSDDFPNGLGNRHDVLGRYFHDHPLAKLVIDLPRAFDIRPATYITRPSLDRSEPLYAAAYMQWWSATELVKSIVAGHPGKSKQIGFTVFGTMVPTPEDRVTLAPESERRAGGPNVHVRLSYPKAVYDTLERAREDLLAILGQAGWQPRMQVWKVEPPGNSVHYGGTCRMHASPKLGVVDRYSRVHGVANVAVADSSVFTTGPEKNPVLTAIALAARAADQLAQDLLGGRC